MTDAGYTAEAPAQSAACVLEKDAAEDARPRGSLHAKRKARKSARAKGAEQRARLRDKNAADKKYCGYLSETQMAEIKYLCRCDDAGTASKYISARLAEAPDAVSAQTVLDAALFACCRCGSPYRVMDMLLRMGADPNARESDRLCDTPLTVLFSFGPDADCHDVGSFEKCALLLADAGADLNARNGEGRDVFEVCRSQAAFIYRTGCEWMYRNKKTARAVCGIMTDAAKKLDEIRQAREMSRAGEERS